MDFSDTPAEADYRARVRAWLEQNAPRFTRRSANKKDDDIARGRAWQSAKADAGYAQITWPRDWGGPGGSPSQAVIFAEEEARFEVASGYFHVSLGMCVPTLLKIGNDAVKARFVPPALRGDEIWCQLFSEPAAGSDLAAVRMRAIREDGGWRLNGQKVWTSGAHYSDFGLVLARSDPALPKHKGLTMFWVDMRTPGIEVRPIRQMSDAAGFNEVYFTDVLVPDDQRLGEPGEGWKVALVTLMNERLAVGGGSGVDYKTLIALAREIDGGSGALVGDENFRARLADWFVQSEALRYMRARAQTALSRGQTPGPENSIGKIIAANQLQDMAKYALDLQGAYGIIAEDQQAPLHALFQSVLLSSPGLRIAGGTDEILKNIIAERVLGLPADARADKDAPFNQLVASGRV